jgi:HAD superfamily hydrolase (TIGR01484 family)
MNEFSEVSTNPLHNNTLVKNIMVFTDLDDTLITTERKGHLHRGRDKIKLLLKNALATRNTVQLPWMIKLNALLKQSDCYVPVTGRTLHSALRVLDPNTYDFLICHFGGYAYTSNDNLIYKAFAAHWNRYATNIRQPMQTYLNRLTLLLDEAAKQLSLSIRLNANATPDAMINEIVLKFNDNSNPTKDDFKAFIEVTDQFLTHEFAHEKPLAIHINGNNFTLFIKAISKAKAVAKFLSLHDTESALIVAAGDSQSDLAFMRLADVMIIPNNTQISHDRLSHD